MLAYRPKAKRSRFSGPKVRTGCITCKTRHLKCDEGKPACLRCRADGFQCDGYLQAVLAPSRSKSGQKLYITQLPKAIDADIGTPEPEKRFFHHFQKTAVRIFYSLSDRVDFWNDVLLRSAQASEAVRHALVALGGAHWLFVTRRNSQSPSHEADALKRLILYQYTLSIRQLRMTISKAESVDLHLILICCLIFVCLEDLLGHYTEALRHLRAGSQLLVSLHPSPPGNHGRNSTSKARCLEKHDGISEIADMFSILGFEAYLFMDRSNLPNLTSYGKLDAEVNKSDVCRDLRDARDQLAGIQVAFDHIFERSEDHKDVALELEILYHTVRQWMIRFDCLVERLNPDELSRHDRHMLITLKFSKQTWLTVLLAKEGRLRNPALTEFLDLAEALVQSSRSNDLPIFTLRGDVNPGLVFICDHSDDEATQQRAISLLRSVHLREGLWDSLEIAEYLEASLKARKRSQRWNRSGGGIPGSMRALSNMNISALSEDNGILIMAKQQMPHHGGRAAKPGSNEVHKIANTSSLLVRYNSPPD